MSRGEGGMSQRQGQGVRTPATDGHSRRDSGRPWPRLLATAALVLSLVGSSLLAWTPFSRPAITRAAGPTVTLDTTSGPPSTGVTVSAVGFPGGDAGQGLSATIQFDGATVGTIQFARCPSSLAVTSGFGPACISTAPGFQYTIPPGTSPGSHSFTVSDPSGLSGQAPFTVPAPTSTPTNTATNIPSPTNTSQASTATPTTTATATKTPVGPTATAPPGATSTPTATTTNTPQANAPTATATNTAAPHAPTATATPTAVPTKKPLTPFVVLTRAEFNRDLLALALHTAPGAKIHIDLKITVVMADGSVRQVFGATRDGVTNARGLYSTTLKITYPAHKPGKASLTISETSGGATRMVKRTYRYRVYG